MGCAVLAVRKEGKKSILTNNHRRTAAALSTLNRINALVPVEV